MIKYNVDGNISGTSFHDVTIDIIPHIFLKFMNNEGEEWDEKISKLWTCEYKGNLFTIYDWKSTNLYNKHYPTPYDFWGSLYHRNLKIGSRLSTVEDQEFADELLKDYLNFIKKD